MGPKRAKRGDPDYLPTPDDVDAVDETPLSDVSEENFVTSKAKHGIRVPQHERNVTKATRIADIQSKWELCIFQFAIKSSPSELSAFAQMQKCNSLIGTTRRYVSNYECCKILYDVSNTFRGNDEFVKSCFTMLTRWWFCRRFSVFLSQFPHLGNAAILNSVTIGLRAVAENHAKFLHLLLEHHDNIKTIITDMLVYGDEQLTDGSSLTSASSCSSKLIEMLPMLKRRTTQANVTEDLCYQASTFFHELLAQSLDINLNGETINYAIADDDNVCRELWDVIVGSYDKLKGGQIRCKCYSRILSMALEVLAFRVLKAEEVDTNSNMYLKLVGFFVKWILVKSPSIEAGVVALKPLLGPNSDKLLSEYFKDHVAVSNVNFLPPSLVKSDETNPYLKESIDSMDIFLVWTFGRLFVRVFNDFQSLGDGKSGGYRNDWSIIAGAMLQIDSLTRTGEIEELIVESGFEGLRYQLSSIVGIPPNRLMCPKFSLPPVQQPNTCHSGICSCFKNLYESLFTTANVECGQAVLGVSITTDVNVHSDCNNVEYEMSQASALHILQQLEIIQDLKATSVANLPIYIGAKSGGGAVSCTVVALVALASFMNDSIVLHKGDVGFGVLRLMFRFRGDLNLHKLSLDMDVWTLLLMLLYLEIRNDAILALEYNNEHLVLYRTYLVQAICRVALFPINSINRVQFKCGETILFEDFARRLFRLFNFRVNVCFMDQNRFERYIRTRVELSQFKSKIGADAETVQEDDEQHERPEDQLFGFLEFNANHAPNVSILSTGLKSEPDYKFKVTTNVRWDTSFVQDNVQLLFFSAACDLCNIIRFCVSNRFVYQRATIDHLIYQLFVRLCSQGEDSGMANIIFNSAMSNVAVVYETNEFGQLVNRSALLQSFGFFTTPQASGDEKGKSKQAPQSNIKSDSLNLSKGRFSKSFFYRVITWTVEAFVTWVPPETASTALCRWAASLPIDSTSRVRVEKVAAARNICTHLILGMLDTLSQGPVDMRDTVILEPLVSAANVCFVNVEFAHKGPGVSSTITLVDDDCEADDDNNIQCIEIKDEPGEAIVPEPERLIDDFTNNVASICTETLDALKHEILRAKRLAELRLKRRRLALYQRLYRETTALVKGGLSFVYITSYLITCFSRQLLNVQNGYFSYHTMQGSQETLIISCKGKKKAIFNNVIDFLTLAKNTASTITRACATVVFRCINGGDVTQEHVSESSAAAQKETELVGLLKHLSTLQDHISKEIKPVTMAKPLHELVKVPPLITNGNGTQTYTNGCTNHNGENSQKCTEETYEDDGEDDDDLDDFVDFETDKHLSMISYTKPTKKLKASHKLRLVTLRGEWKCLIKSYFN